MNFHMALRFLLELMMLVAIGFGFYNMGNSFFTKLLLCIVFLAITIITWGTFGSPNAPFVLQGYRRFLLELAILFVSIGFMWTLLHPIVIISFAIIFLLNCYFIS